MASLVLTDAYVSINSVNLSSFGRSVQFDYSAEQQDDTAFGDNTHSRLGGLKDWQATVEMNQDYAAGGPDATLFPIVGTVVAVEFRPTSGSRSSTNPGYTGSALVQSYRPLGNSVGDAARCTVQLVAAGTLTRSTS